MQSVLLLTVLTQSFIATASPLVERSTPLSFAEKRPQKVSYDWTTPYVKDFTIHGSCNATQTNVLRRGLEDAVTLAQHAKEHILVHGKESPIYQKYYGALPTGAVIGWFDTIATANRAGVTFRCDDPDKKCATENRWAGHWRGKDAPSETVICDVSFFERLPLEDLCSRGYKIATGKVYSYWGADLIHRMFHVDIVGQNAITHASHGYQDALNLAAGQNYTQTATNTDSLIYFAVEAY
ncbi:CELP0023 Effector like protein, partial [Blumeria hordei DH14]